MLTRFIILGRSRTGSSFLVSLLNSSPQIACEGETLRRIGDDREDDRFRWVYRDREPQVKAAGFKFFYYHPIDRPGSPAWEMLRSWIDIRVIHLKRRNIARSIVSREIALKEGFWAMRKGDPDRSRPVEQRKVRLTRDYLDRQIAATTRRMERCDRLRHTHAYMEVWYEHLARDPQGQCDRVAQFLELDRWEASSDYRRQNPEPLEQLLEIVD